MKVSSPSQIKRLVELIEENTSLATNFRRGVPQTDVTKTGWKEVTRILNSLGPPVRAEKEWQKVWFDLKFKVKKKLMFNRKVNEATGGRPIKQKFLSEVDEAVARIIALNEPVDAVGNLFWGNQSSFNQTPSSSSFLEFPSTSNGIFTSRKKTTDSVDVTLSLSPEKVSVTNFQNANASFTNTNSFEEMKILLQKQILIQEQLKDSLGKVESHLKDTCRCEKKRLSLEAKKLKLRKLEMQRKERQRIESNEIKLIELEIKKRELEIQEQKLEEN